MVNWRNLEPGPRPTFATQVRVSYDGHLPLRKRLRMTRYRIVPSPDGWDSGHFVGPGGETYGGEEGA